MTSDVVSILAILEYLGLPPESDEARLVTGLTPSRLASTLAGTGTLDAGERLHLNVIAELIEHIRDARLAASDSERRDHSALAWLHSGVVSTSRGVKPPIEVFSDTELASEALRDLKR